LSRLATAVRGDFLLQWRFGIVAAGIVVLVTACGLLWPLDLSQAGFALPTFVLGNLTVTAFFFVAAMVLFEKDDGTLEAIVVSPLRVGEYLASKVLTLTLLAVIETVLIVAILYPGPLAFGPLISGSVAAAAAYVLFGFIVVARYHSITDLLFPAVFVNALWQIPVLGSLGVFDHAVLYLHPVRAMLVWIEASIRPLSGAEWAYAVGYSAVTLAVLYRFAHQAFGRFVIRARGARR
jgi:fluoroquinolone transport system permease protein